MKEINVKKEIKTIIGTVEKGWNFDNDVNILLSAGWTLTARGVENGVLYGFLEREKRPNCLKVDNIEKLEILEDKYGNPQAY